MAQSFGVRSGSTRLQISRLVGVVGRECYFVASAADYSNGFVD